MLAVPFLIGCLDRTPETYHSVGIRRGTATSNFHLQRDNLESEVPAASLALKNVSPSGSAWMPG